MKSARELLRHSKHVRNMKEGAAAPLLLLKLLDAEASLAGALKARDMQAIEDASGCLMSAIERTVPRRRYDGVRENLEVLTVAVAVAMAFRTYFFQPFKIPTGSMQPTLYGIHYETADKRGFTDYPPMNLVKWALLGKWYSEIKAPSAGTIEDEPGSAKGNNTRVYRIGRHQREIPAVWNERFRPGDQVRRGQVLASGYRITGDHVFVNRVRWNFAKPVCGQVIVFETRGIRYLEMQSRGINQYYIKRLVGLPGQKIGINPPYLVIDGSNFLDAPAPIARIQERREGFRGYQVTHIPGTAIADTEHFVTLDTRQYFACGDNTTSSSDSRYWGPVRQQNLVGPGAMVYWPASARWGRIR